MGGRGGKKKWNRRRNAERRANNAEPESQKKREQQRTAYVPVVQGNARMEAYYAVQGMHGGRWVEEEGEGEGDGAGDSRGGGEGGAGGGCGWKFVPCRTDEEREAERWSFMDSLRTILPASFRIGRDVGDDMREKLERELDYFCGKDIEIEVERPDFLLRSWEHDAKGEGKGATDGGKKKAEKGKKEGGADAAVKSEPDMGVENSEDGAANGEVMGGKEGGDEGDENRAVRVPSASGTLEKRIVHPARAVPFVPHAYQLSVDRRTIRRNPALVEFHEWLKVHTAAGFLTRQETVSMIPPVVLDPEPGDRVLDMCAAPGSKTSQMVEAVAAGCEGVGEDGEPRGLVVANDMDPKRAYMLVHQLRRINTPNVYVCSCDAQFFPTLERRSEDRDGGGGGGEDAGGGAPSEGTFDKVLCDVPCSGDGTTRKNPGIWKHWSQVGSLALHPLQLQILLQGARLTKVGGYVCYSTCSLNPVENEAVVAEALRRAGGALELVDRRAEMEGLRARPGWGTWTVMCEKGRSGLASRKARKNYEKKNNERMRKRRIEWAERRRKEREEKEKAKGENGVNGEDANNKEAKEGEESKPDGGDAVMADANDAEGEAKDVAMSGDASKGEEKEGTRDDDGVATEAPLPTLPSVFKTSPPTSWEREYLLKRADEAGLEVLTSYGSLPEGGPHRRRVRQSCFPPTAEEVKSMRLEKCMRCLPQDMDTGGFFVALFRKVGPMGARAKRKAEEEEEEEGEESANAGCEGGREEGGSGAPEAKRRKSDGEEEAAGAAKDSTTEEVVEAPKTGKEEEPDTSLADDMDADAAPAEESGDGEGEVDRKEGHPKAGRKGKKGGGGSGGGGGNGKNPRGGGPRISSENLYPVNSDLWPKIKKFYGFGPTFPEDQFMTRSTSTTSGAKVIYFIARSVKTELLDRGIQSKVQTISSGLKAFERNNKDCAVAHRIAQESLHFVAPHMTEGKNRLVSANPEDFVHCIGPGAIWLSTFGEGFAKKVRKLETGSFCVALEGYEKDVSKKMFLTMWRCRSDSVNCLVSKQEMDGIKSKMRALGFEVAVPSSSGAEADENECKTPADERGE